MADMRAIGTALGSYQTDYDKYPTAAGGNFTTTTWGADASVGASYYSGSLKDGWGKEYYYKSLTDGQHYTLCSYGKKGAAAGSEFEADLYHMDGQMYEADPTKANGNPNDCSN